MTSGDRFPPLATIDRHFSRNMPFTRFALNVFVFTCPGLLPFLILYLSLRQGFWSSLIADPLARNLLTRQVATNGLPVVYLINHVGFALYAVSTGRNEEGASACGRTCDEQPDANYLISISGADSEVNRPGIPI